MATFIAIFILLHLFSASSVNTVEPLTPSKMKEGSNFHTVQVYAGPPIQASIVKDLLENEGIFAFVKDDFIGTLVPWHAAPGGVNPVKVFVSDSNQVQAMKVVEQFEANTSKSS
ncbi:MAG: hypothetical protein CMP48_26430 [Rickettsiales bacterium]|nr:hypothetical protein [Rickettsiales bacterium]